MPLLMTVEMWWLGSTMEPWKLALFLVLFFSNCGHDRLVAVDCKRKGSSPWWSAHPPNALASNLGSSTVSHA